MLLATPAAGQMQMPGMTMPAPAKKKPAKPKQKAAKTKAAPAKTEPNAAPMDPDTPAAPMTNVAKPAEPSAEPESMDHSQMDHSQMGAMEMPMAAQPGHGSMAAALGPYPMTRESSGTAWQPDASAAMRGPMLMSGGWMLMAHGTLNLVYDHQSGPRGDDKGFASGMLMGMARRPLGNGMAQLRAMVSPDPLMGKSGYPLLLASGETANGVDHLIDRQHPHDVFMELSASVSQNLGDHSSLFLYAGLPGEPAFGPPAFMHRESILDSPEAPITHHWLDSTHISFGVLTAGIVMGRAKAEISRFNAREPDQHRWDIETGPIDSTAVRISWNPTRTLALQGSWGHFVDPEQLEPGVNQKRLSASALYAREIAPGWKLAGTLAWGRKQAHGHKDDAFAAEASLRHGGWTLFGRGELAQNRELLDIEDGPAFRVGKLSLGAVRDVPLTDHFSLGVGGQVAVNFVPDGLEAEYGGSNPVGAMAFVRLKLD